jgi:hypothetical protein
LHNISRGEATKMVSVSPRNIADAARVDELKGPWGLPCGSTAARHSLNLKAASRKRHKLVPYPKRSGAHLKQG